jgi:[ribosomal protein S5]-alanine N-acetyltransferase
MAFLFYVYLFMLELNFDPFPIINTERLVLRRMVLADAKDYFLLRSSPEAMKYICKPLHKSLDDTKTMIYKINEMINFNDGISWAVCLKSDDKMIGSVSFHRIEKENFRAEIGYMLHPNFWRNGLISESIQAIIEYAFNVIGLHSIEAQIDPNNIGSEKVLQKFGFIKEAYYKENYYYDGDFLDTAVYSLLRNK